MKDWGLRRAPITSEATSPFALPLLAMGPCLPSTWQSRVMVFSRNSRVLGSHTDYHSYLEMTELTRLMQSSELLKAHNTQSFSHGPLVHARADDGSCIRLFDNPFSNLL